MVTMVLIMTMVTSLCQGMEGARVRLAGDAVRVVQEATIVQETTMEMVQETTMETWRKRSGWRRSCLANFFGVQCCETPCKCLAIFRCKASLRPVV